MGIPCSNSLPARPGEYIVKLKNRNSAANFCAEQKGEQLSEDFVLVKGDATFLSSSHEVDYVVPNHLYKRHQPTENPEAPEIQWGLHNTGQDGGTPDADIDAPESWRVSTGNVLVAVLDTGVDIRHPDLQPNLYHNKGEIPDDGIDNDGNGVVDDVHGYDAADRDGNPWSDDPHGTHCAGTIAASGKVIGAAPTTKVLPIKIFDEDDWTDAASIVRALQYAQQAGAKIASHSYGGLAYNQAVRDMFASTDMLHFVASGNYSSNNDENKNFPSSYNLENMVSVAASDRNDKFAEFSNYGPGTVHLAAPGVDIYSTTSYGNHGSWSGTSMACPHAAGAAALVASVFPDESPVQWKERILESVDKQPGWETKLETGGRLNTAKALGLKPNP